MFDVKNKKVLVIGLGISGYTSAELLAQKGALVKITEASDSEPVRKYLKKLREGGYAVQEEIGRHTKDFCSSAELAVASPGVNLAPLYASGILHKKLPVIGELELGFLFCPSRIIAVTGTNGKSTTTELIGNILSCSGRHAIVCGNIGNPLSGEVNTLTEKSVAVVEVSSFQLETIESFRPHVAVLLNVAEDHYERHGDYNRYKTEKFKIFKNQTSYNWAILHKSFYDDPMLSKVKSKIIFYGTKKEYDEGVITLFWQDMQERIMKIEEIPLEGEHNFQNVLCAAYVSSLMGIEPEAIRKGIMNFKALKHRFEKIGSVNNIEFMDDSKATNIDATRQALESIAKKVILIAGGRDKGGNYGAILPLVKRKVKAMVLIGEAREKIKTEFSKAIPIFMAPDMRGAVRKAFSLADKKEVILLSPMCSSFDMFSSYKERGDVFRKEVARLSDSS